MDSEIELIAATDISYLLRVKNLLIDFDLAEGTAVVDYGDSVGVIETIPLAHGLELVKSICNTHGHPTNS